MDLGPTDLGIVDLAGEGGSLAIVQKLLGAERVAVRVGQEGLIAIAVSGRHLHGVAETEGHGQCRQSVPCIGDVNVVVGSAGVADSRD